MRTISWTKPTLIILFAAAIAAGCGSDTAAPTPTPTPEAGTCGNSKIDTGEVCDKLNLNGKTCATAMMGMFTGGSLACSSTCKTFVVTGCTNASGSGGSTSGGGAGGVGTGGGPSGGKDGGTAGATNKDGGSGGTSGTDASTPDATTPPPVDSGTKG